MTPDEAVTLTTRAVTSMGMSSLQQSLQLCRGMRAGKACAGEINDLRVYCCETASIAGNTIRYELRLYLHLYSMLITGIERASLIRQGIESLAKNS
ncbi:hypothetical protein KCP76_05555 [Salmonella enterica subsp. enterica serovar Weltevreden]|nr:hypothetical protein KCP76_05555 [Salmonella enterica subsp. enterica serovar Weltevreden]